MRTTVMGALLFSFATVISAQQGARVTPDSFYTQGTEPPALIFASASAAFDASDAPTEMLPKSWVAQHERMREMERVARVRGIAASTMSAGFRPCAVYQEDPQVEYPVREDILSTIRNATAIFEGTIAEVTPGFFYGHAASLLRVTGVSTLKGSTRYAHVTDTLYARYPFASFSAGGVDYCTVSGAPPEIGSRVLVFAFGAPIDERGQLVFSFKNDILIETAAGVSFPPLLEIFRTAGARGLDDVAARIRKQLSGSGGKEKREVPR